MALNRGAVAWYGFTIWPVLSCSMLFYPVLSCSILFYPVPSYSVPLPHFVIFNAHLLTYSKKYLYLCSKNKALSMEKVYSHSRWAAVSLLSLIIAAVAFVIPCPVLTIVLVPVSIITGVIALSKYINVLDSSKGSIFDDYGYC